MDVKAIPALIVGVMVAVVMVGAVLPVFAETTSATDTFTNGGYYEMTYDEREEVTILWEYSNPYQLKVNDEVIPLDSSNFSSSQRKTILMGDAFVMRTNASYQNGTWYPLVQFNGATGSSIWAGAVPGSEANMSVVCSNGTATVTVNAGEPSTFSYTYLYTVSNNGQYVMKYSDGSAYMLKDSEFIAMGTSVVDGVEIGVKITGNIEDGATIATWKATDTWTFSDIAVNATAVNSYVDLYQLTTITASAEDDNSHSGTITYSYYLVPTEITAERAVHPDATLATLINILPLIAVAGLILGGIVWVMYRKG